MRTLLKQTFGWMGRPLVLLMLTASVVAPAQALELRVADSFPAGHYLVRLMLKPWMDEVTRKTNGAVTFS